MRMCQGHDDHTQSSYPVIYHSYAPFYDGSGQIRFALLFGQYLQEILTRHHVAGRQALDLACGTGTLALLLAEAGWDVIGLDQSAAMLALAQAKATSQELPGRVHFVRGDMRHLATTAQRSVSRMRSKNAPQSDAIHGSQFDLVTCTYDSLNYLLHEDDLAACVAGVAWALRPGGLFVADMNTRHFLEHDWGACDIDERPGFVQIAQSHFDPASACSTMLLTGFAGDDQHGYQRFDETHVERAYPPAVIAGLLQAAGLHVEAAYDCFTFQLPYERSQRIAWVARKPLVYQEH